MKFPAIDSKRKWAWAGIGYLCFCAAYTFTGRVHFRDPVTLERSFIDDLTPFIDWSVWVYHSQLLFLILCVWLLKEAKNICRVLYSMSFASVLSFCVFLIYPTVITRIRQPAAGLTAMAFELLYRIDSPSNCLPSLHVALAWLASTGLARERGRAGGLAVLWAAMISASTMTTGQHYFVDVAAGLGLALVCALAVSRFGFAPASVSESSHEARAVSGSP
jgi:membrane-associated phospholipid phosphatase